MSSNQISWKLRRLKRKDVDAQYLALGNTVQSPLKGDFEAAKTSTVAPLHAPEVKISSTSICSETSSVQLSFPSGSTPSTIPTPHSKADFNNAELTFDSDSAVESHSCKNKSQQKTSTPASGKKASQMSRRPPKMVFTTVALQLGALGMETNKRGRFECHFWVPETALSVFTDKNDRRLKSIARSSGCSIELTDDSRLDPFGIPKRKVLIRSATTYGMAKCRNLIEARFPDFTLKRASVTAEVVS